MSTNRLSNVLQAKNATRQSNVARPSVGQRLGAPMSALRSSSATRLSTNTAGRSSSGVGLRRYGSEGYLCTPNRYTLSTPMRGRSPAVRHSMMPMDSSRKSKHENILKLQEILKRDAAFYGDLNLKNGCLKSMTVNQFHMIMDHFIRLICGKKLVTFIKKEDPNPIAGIQNFLEQVQYPFTISKSMLKTPNAPHTFDQIVSMLLWLGDISSVSTVAADDELIHQFLLTRDEQFPGEEYTATFSKAMQDGYKLWDKDNFEHDILIKRLIDDLIAAKLDNKVTSVAELHALTENLKMKSKQLMDNPVQLNNIQQFEQLESKYIEYETMENDLLNQLREKQDRLAAVNVLWNDKRAKMQQTQARIQELSTQIQEQKYNIIDYKKLTEQITMLKTAITSLENEKRLIEEEVSNQQITHALLMKNVSKAITEINNRSMQIIKMLNNSRSITVNECDLDKLNLPATPSLQQVEQVYQLLSHVYSVIEVQKHNSKIELDQATKKLNILQHESTALSEQFESTQKNYENLLNEHKILEKKYALKSRKNENSTRDLSKQAQNAEEKLQSLENEIILAHAKEEELMEKNAKFMTDGEAHAIKIIMEKQRLADQLDDLDRMLDTRLEGLSFLN